MLSESKQLVMENYREADFRKNWTKQNGKEKCFICLRDSDPPEQKLIEESDCLSLYYNKKTKYMLFKSNQGSGNKNSAYSNQFEMPQPNQNIIINTKNVQFPNLFAPCKCDKLAHLTCLTNYCIVNITFKCNKCNSNYDVKFSEKKNKFKKFKLLFLLTLLIIFHSGIFLILFLLLIGYFDFTQKVKFLEYVIGGFFILVNIFLMFISFLYIRKIYKRKYLKPTFSINSEEKRKIDSKIGTEFYNFMMNSHKCSKMDLLEKKISNNIFQETIFNEKKKISDFIKENNNLCVIKRYGTVNNLNEENLSLNKFNKPIFSNKHTPRSIYKKENQDDSYNRKSPQEKSKILEKNINVFNIDREKSLTRKSVSSNRIIDPSPNKEVEYKINIISEEKYEETIKKTQDIKKNKGEYKILINHSGVDDEAIYDKINEKMVSANKIRSHLKKLSINQNLRMMDTNNLTSVENILNRRISNAQKMNIFENKNFKEENQEPLNSESPLNP